MKLCIDCKHFYVPEDSKPEYALCRALEGPISLVTGQPKGQTHPYCEVARITPCGEHASMFQTKEVAYDKP